MELCQVGSMADADLATAAFQCALLQWQRENSQTTDFPDMNAADRMEVIKIASGLKAAASLPLPSAAANHKRREHPMCDIVRRTYGDKYRIRYYECVECARLYWAEAIPLHCGDGPREVIIVEGFCSESCHQEHEPMVSV